LDVAEQLEQVQRDRELERRQLQEEIEALRKGGTEKMSSSDLQKYADIEEELERMRSKSEAAEKELAEIRSRSNDKPTVPAKVGGADDGERERMRLLMRAEKVACATGLDFSHRDIFLRLNRAAKLWINSLLKTPKSLQKKYPASKCKSWSVMRHLRMPVHHFPLLAKRQGQGRRVALRL
jgi:hypothetical protein